MTAWMLADGMDYHAPDGSVWRLYTVHRRIWWKPWRKCLVQRRERIS